MLSLSQEYLVGVNLIPPIYFVEEGYAEGPLQKSTSSTLATSCLFRSSISDGPVLLIIGLLCGRMTPSFTYYYVIL
jgi:hypothetical protein